MSDANPIPAWLKQIVGEARLVWVDEAPALVGEPGNAIEVLARARLYDLGLRAAKQFDEASVGDAAAVQAARLAAEEIAQAMRPGPGRDAADRGARQMGERGRLQQ
jgi:ABC-type taurine transport system ATPase subunit